MFAWCQTLSRHFAQTDLTRMSRALYSISDLVSSGLFNSRYDGCKTLSTTARSWVFLSKGCKSLILKPVKHTRQIIHLDNKTLVFLALPLIPWVLSDTVTGSKEGNKGHAENKTEQKLKIVTGNHSLFHDPHNWPFSRRLVLLMLCVINVTYISLSNDRSSPI